jgi:hypothetical protein
MKPKPSSMIKFGIFFLILDMLVAGFYYHRGMPGDRQLVAMWLGGCILWIIGLLIWTKNVQDHPNS